VHFTNEAIEIINIHFLMKHTNSTTYYLWDNGQTKSTNKVIILLQTKLINEKTNQDEHLHIVLDAYGTFFKVTTSHTLFQLVYKLHPLMPTNYLLPTTNPQTSKEFSKLEL
jgi:hypothetical protein